MLFRDDWFIYIFLIIFIFYTDALRIINKSSGQLSSLFQKSKDPLIVLIDAGSGPNIPDFDEVAKDTESTSDEYNEGQSGEVVKYEEKETVEQKAVYILKDILKSPDTNNEDPSLTKTKNALRQALRQRCQKVDNCVKKCPPKKPKCPANCQQVFDNLNLCEEPTTTRKPKNCATGKTMPPTWRF